MTVREELIRTTAGPTLSTTAVTKFVSVVGGKPATVVAEGSATAS